MAEREFPALTESIRRYDAAHLLLEGLNESYLECANAGRLDDWQAAAIAIVKLIVGRAPPVYKRPFPHNTDASGPSEGGER